ncbi:MAG: DUF167 domain-containing protein [Candidatus Omnitrophica bacterium]|nr:DUF167 domain-containing protein [Candidatus Omnitrophota bacterium]
MRIQVRVIPRARQRAVEEAPDGSLRVKVTEPADEGRANAAVIEALAEHFGLPRRLVAIVRGAKSRQKLVEILPHP